MNGGAFLMLYTLRTVRTVAGTLSPGMDNKDNKDNKVRLYTNDANLIFYEKNMVHDRFSF